MSVNESITSIKICRRCKDEKPLTEFGKNKYSKDKLQYECKTCICERARQYVENNNESVSFRKKEYRLNNKEKISEYNKMYAEKNKETLRERRQVAYFAHKDENKARKKLLDKSYRERNKFELSARRKVKLQEPEQRAKNIARAKSWYWKNKDSVCEKSKEMYMANKDRIIARVRAYEAANPEKTRLHWRVKSSRRRARLQTVGGYYTKSDIERIFVLQKEKCANCGCSIKDMYHIDHRIPVAKGGDNNPKNIDLLCPSCNLRKAAKLPHEFAKENGRLI